MDDRKREIAKRREKICQAALSGYGADTVEFLGMSKENVSNALKRIASERVGSAERKELGGAKGESMRSFRVPRLLWLVYVCGYKNLDGAKGAKIDQK